MGDRIIYAKLVEVLVFVSTDDRSIIAKIAEVVVSMGCRNKDAKIAEVLVSMGGRSIDAKTCKSFVFVSKGYTSSNAKAVDMLVFVNTDDKSINARICGGAGVCEHGRLKYRCKDCGGSGICEHGRRKPECKDCGGVNICEHGRRKYQCKGCGGVNMCEHGRRKSYCPDCNGSSLCNAHAEPCNSGCRSRGHRRLGCFCAHCFAHIFKDNPRALTVRKEFKELRVVAHIASTYGNFIHDKPLYEDMEDGCFASKRSVDLMRLINDTMLCIETDEGQHKSNIQTDEEHKYNDLFMEFSGKYILIRYNPDAYNNAIGSTIYPIFCTRMSRLEYLINILTRRINNGENKELVEI